MDKRFYWYEFITETFILIIKIKFTVIIILNTPNKTNSDTSVRAVCSPDTYGNGCRWKQIFDWPLYDHNLHLKLIIIRLNYKNILR